MNVTDSDGDTPLYVVENIETARYLVERGATVDRRNIEGVSVCAAPILSWLLGVTDLTKPAEHLSEDFQEVAAYLNNLPGSRGDDAAAPVALPAGQHQPSQHAQNIASEHLTSSLLQSAQDIMQRAEAEGRNPEEELRQVVGRAVLEGVVTGYGMSTEAEDRREDRADLNGSNGVKRSRMDDGPG